MSLQSPTFSTDPDAPTIKTRRGALQVLRQTAWLTARYVTTLVFGIDRHFAIIALGSSSIHPANSLKDCGLRVADVPATGR